MSLSLQVVVVAACTTVACLPLVRFALLRHSILDQPSDRSSHTAPTPRGGGLGVLVGLVAASIVAVTSGLLKPDISGLAVGGAVATLTLTGFRDDLRSLSSLPRLAIQGSAGLGVGLAVTAGSGAWVLVGAGLSGLALMVLIVNVVNFMDGINGITALTMMTWGGTVLWAASTFANPLGVVAGATALGTAIAFLPFNAPRAFLFLGDAGSYLYEALVASTSMVLIAAGMSPIMVLAPLIPYFADVMATLLRRARRGERLFEAHREHLYQVLTGPMGRSHTIVSVAYACGSALCGAMAILMPAPHAALALGVVAAAVAIGPSLPITRRTGGQTARRRLLVAQGKSR